MNDTQPRRFEMGVSIRSFVFGFGLSTDSVFGVEAYLGLGPIVFRYLHRP